MEDKKVMNRGFVVLGAILIQLALGAIYAWSVFTPPLTEAGWTKEDTQWVFAIGLASFAVFMVFAGKKLNSWGPQRLAIIGGFILGIGYLLAGMIGGTSFWQGKLGDGPYVVGGLGATFFDPGEGFDDELRASLNLGIGYEQPLGKTLAVRFEARGYATLVNSSGGFFCSGGCIVSISGDVFTQGEVMLGLSARF